MSNEVYKTLFEQRAALMKAEIRERQRRDMRPMWFVLALTVALLVWALGCAA
jgi:hypothetical protein